MGLTNNLQNWILLAQIVSLKCYVIVIVQLNLWEVIIIILENHMT